MISSWILPLIFVITFCTAKPYSSKRLSYGEVNIDFFIFPHSNLTGVLLPQDLKFMTKMFQRVLRLHVISSDILN